MRVGSDRKDLCQERFPASDEVCGYIAPEGSLGMILQSLGRRDACANLDIKHCSLSACF